MISGGIVRDQQHEIGYIIDIALVFILDLEHVFTSFGAKMRRGRSCFQRRINPLSANSTK